MMTSQRLHAFGAALQNGHAHQPLPPDPDDAAALALSIEAADPHRTLYSVAGRRTYRRYWLWLTLNLAVRDQSWVYFAVARLLVHNDRMRAQLEKARSERDAARTECERLRGELAKLGRRAFWATGDSATEHGMRMPFGIHNGKLVSELSDTYLSWALDNLKNIKPGLRAAMESELASRTQREAK